MRLPEEAGIGATPARRANLASLVKRAAPAVSAMSLAAISVPQPLSSSSSGARSRDQSCDLALRALWPCGCGGGSRPPARGRPCTLVLCSARASLRARRSSQAGRSRQPAGNSSSGQRSCRCQRSRCWSAERALTMSSRWSSRSLISRAASSRWAAGRVSGPSRRAALATARASIGSDLPAAALAAAALAHQLRGDPDHPLARLRPGSAPALRRHGGSLRSPRPARRRAPRPRRAARRIPASSPPRSARRRADRLRGHRGAGVGGLVGIRSDHDHLVCPFDWSLPSKRTSG